MTQKYYNVAETAQILGIGENDVKQMLGRQELHGYRDGTDWKFKVEDIDRVARQQREQAGDTPAPEEEGDVLLSELELGQSEAGASGTVIGMQSGEKAAADSDLQIDFEDDSSIAGAGGMDSGLPPFEDLELTLEEDHSPEDRGVESNSAAPIGGSDINLAGDESDDDQVIGGSGTGSDITIGGDSGISLVDPADSGLSLEEPLDLAGSGVESLELGEDDMLSVEGDAGELKADDDFLLTPLEEIDDEESESGSQVIALEAEGEGEVAATMIAPGGGMAAMLDEDLSAEPIDEMDITTAMGAGPLVAQPGGLVEGAPVSQAAVAALPEAPYTAWNVVSLALCCILLVLCGMFMYDLMRNMWSWGGAYSANSALLDTLGGWLGWTS